MNKRVFVSLVLIAVVVVSNVWAAPVPSVINYQGYLSDETGDPLPDGDYEITFRLYTVSTGGAALWTETWSGENAIPLAMGRFRVNIGSMTSFDSAGLDFSEQYYLEIQLASDAPFSPRQAFASVPYAMHASHMSGTPLPAGEVVGTTDAQTLSNKTLSGAVVEESTMDNTVIGAITPAAGTFSNLTATGDLTVSGTILGRATIDGAHKTADYTLTATDDIILADTSSQNVTFTLPATAGNTGRTYTIKLDAGGNPLTIATDGSETIDGRADLMLQSAGQAVRLVSDGTGWQVIGEVGFASFHREATDLDTGAGADNAKDKSLSTDLIITGSQCVGHDCLDIPDFGFDTLVLKENNVGDLIAVGDTLKRITAVNSDTEVEVDSSYTVVLADESLIITKTDLLVDTDGDVGIGTAIPDTKFEIAFAPSVDVEINQGTTDAARTFFTLRSPNGTKFHIPVANGGTIAPTSTLP